MKADRHLRGSTVKCPKCGSRKVAHDPTLQAGGYGPGLATCANCKCLWEPFEPDQIWDPSNPVCSLKDPCNNCAFRPGSNEQQDREKWLALVNSLKDGASFHCHKGVPIEPDAEHGFAYPAKMVDVVIDGEVITKTTVSDRSKLRMCRGYLNASRKLSHIALKRREAEDAQSDGVGS